MGVDLSLAGRFRTSDFDQALVFEVFGKIDQAFCTLYGDLVWVDQLILNGWDVVHGSHLQVLSIQQLPQRVRAVCSQSPLILHLVVGRYLRHWQFFNFPDTCVEGIASVFQRKTDNRRSLFLVNAQIALILGVDEKEKVVGADLVLIAERLMRLMQVDQPGKAAGIRGNDVVLVKVVLFSRDVASIRDVLDPQRRFQLYLIALLLERAEWL